MHVVLTYHVLRICFLSEEKCMYIAKMFFEKFLGLLILHCVFYHLRHSRWKNTILRFMGPEILVPHA